MNNTAAVIGEENQYEYQCVICGVTVFGPKRSCLCDECRALTELLRGFLVEAYLSNGHPAIADYILSGRMHFLEEMTAMRRAYEAGYLAAEGRDYKCPSCGLETISEDTLIARLNAASL